MVEVTRLVPLCPPRTSLAAFLPFAVVAAMDQGVFVEPLTEERAARTLYRIELLRKIREQVRLEGGGRMRGRGGWGRTCTQRPEDAVASSPSQFHILLLLRFSITR